MVTKGVHGRLWDFGSVHQPEIMSRIASGQGGRTGTERITGETQNSSEWLDFDICDLVWTHDNPNAKENPRLARWLGVAHQVGSDLCRWVSNGEGNMLARTAVQRVTDLDWKQPGTAERIKAFDAALSMRLRDATHQLPDVVSGGSFFLGDVAEDDDPEPGKPVCADGKEGAFSQDDFTPAGFV
jgi:hypothetical protein